jgi:hypothetical protein
MQTAALLLGLVAIIWKATDAIKVVFPKLPALVTQAIAEALGIGVAYLVWVSDLATAIQVGSWNFNTVNGWTVLIVGLVLGSSSSATFDTIKAIGSIGTTTNPLEPATEITSSTGSVDSITINANTVTVTGTSTTSSDSPVTAEPTDLTTANKGPDQ